MKFYTTHDVARLLGWSEAQVRSHARVGYLAPSRGPRNGYRFSFQDLVLLRAAKALGEARIGPRRVRRALRALARELPAGRSLSGLRLSSDGTRVVVRDGRDAWQPESGQLVLDFEVSELARQAAPVARRLIHRARRSDEPLTAEQWYTLGLDLESAAPAEAREAYVRALALDPRHASARVNLGRWLQADGHPAEAVAQYRVALAAHPHHSTAAFNLGTALEELGRRSDAIAAYRLALEADPQFADAHFNLARLYDQAGKRAAALRHLQAYRQLSQ
jgi:tetratricopeptide (TPR) repeat protein